VNGENAKLGEIPYQVHINKMYIMEINTHKNTSMYKIFIYKYHIKYINIFHYAIKNVRKMFQILKCYDFYRFLYKPEQLSFTFVAAQF